LCSSKGTVVDKLNQVKKLKVGCGPSLQLKILAAMKEQAELDDYNQDEGFEEAIEFEILSEDDESDQEPEIDSQAFAIKWKAIASTTQRKHFYRGNSERTKYRHNQKQETCLGSQQTK